MSSLPVPVSPVINTVESVGATFATCCSTLWTASDDPTISSNIDARLISSRSTTAYARPGRMRAAWAYFVSFQQAAKDFARLSQTKLTMPVLSIGGEKANGSALGQQVQLVATNARTVTLPNTGHWVMEESPQATMDALVSFLLPSAATPTASAASAPPMSQASRSMLPQMRWTPDEVRANQTGTDQVGSSFLAGVSTKV